MSALREFCDKFSLILKEEPRYKPDAYLFVMASLSRAMRKLSRPRHVTGRELLRGIREESREQFGPMSVSVFEHWGVKNSLDFGQIVFKMVQHGVLSKTETDTLDDFRDDAFFKNLFDMDAAYRLEKNKKKVKHRVTKQSNGV